MTSQIDSTKTRHLTVLIPDPTAQICRNFLEVSKFIFEKTLYLIFKVLKASLKKIIKIQMYGCFGSFKLFSKNFSASKLEDLKL
jgi:hypothetical protein